MAIEIEGPDGSVVEFPDGTSEAQINLIMRREFGGPKKTSQGLGFMQGVTTVLEKVPGTPLDLIPGLDSRPARVAAREGLGDYYANRELTERPGQLGKIVGGLTASAPLAFVGGPLTSGALQGYAASEADSLQGRLGDAALGAAGGKVAHGVLSAAGKALAPVIDPAVKKLAEGGVRMTPGQIRGGRAMIREDKLMSKPRVGDAIREGRIGSVKTYALGTINQALKPLGVTLDPKVPAGHEAVNAAHQMVSEVYDAIVPNLRLQLDGRALVKSIEGQARNLAEPQQNQLQTMLVNIMRDGQPLAGKTLQGALSEVRRLGNEYGASAIAQERELGRVLTQAHENLTSQLLKQNPGAAEALGRANKAFRGLAIVESAAKGAKEGIPTPGQLKTAVRQADGSARKNAVARGRAYMQPWSEAGSTVLPAQIPNSGSTDRLFAGKRGLLGRAGDVVAAGRYALDDLLAQNAVTGNRLQLGVGEALRLLSQPAGRAASLSIANRPRQR